MSIRRSVSTAAATRRRPSKFTPGPPLSRPSSPSSHISFLPPFRFCCRLSGFSTPLTMLSRKYVNVHACPIIRSSRSLFSSVPSFAISRSTFLPCPPACLSAPCETEIDRSSRESHEFTSCRDSELSRASGTRKRSISTRFAPVVARRER